MWKKILKNKSGSSIVEVMVAFTIALMMFAMFNHVVTLSNSFIMKSHDKIQAQESFNADYYDSTKGTKDTVLGSVSLIPDKTLSAAQTPLQLDGVILQSKIVDGITIQKFTD